MKRRVLMKSGLAFGAGVMIARQSTAQGGTLNLYSARHYNTDEALYGNFADLTGIKINRIDAEPDPLVERLRAEGDKSPCDVLITTDAGRIERARQMGLLQAVSSKTLEAAVPAHLRDPDGSWFGFSKRARVIFYNKAKVQPSDVPTYESLADPKWKGRLLVRTSGHIYNQSLTGSLLAALGPEKTEAWAKGIAANLARAPRGGDTDQIKAIAAGEADLCLANTYYFANLLRSKKPEDRELAAKVGVVFPNQADRGTHVNISGGAVAKLRAEQGSGREVPRVPGVGAGAALLRRGQLGVSGGCRCRAVARAEVAGHLQGGPAQRPRLRPEQRGSAEDHGPRRLEVAAAAIERLSRITGINEAATMSRAPAAASARRSSEANR